MRKRRAIAAFICSLAAIILLASAAPTAIDDLLGDLYTNSNRVDDKSERSGTADRAIVELEKISIKGRAPKSGYERSQFGDGWAKQNGCSTREIILFRDLTDVKLDGECKISSGTLNDPYTGEIIKFSKDDSSAVQIDHVIALSDSWQKGAQNLSKDTRIQLANDPLELLAVDGPANQQKSDGDAATWLPKNKSFRCEYVARQIAIKIKYNLWVTQAEHDAMKSVLNTCPGYVLPSAKP